MKRALVVVVCWLLPALCLAAISYQEDDLVFDDVGEETPTPSSVEPETSESKKDQHNKWQRVEKLLGMPDAVATVGHVFKLHVPKQAFSGSIDYYEARGINGKGLAHWLHWDEPAGALSGVPSRKDVGRHRVVVKAFGKHSDTAQDSFLIHVVPDTNEHFKHKDAKKRCGQDQERTLLTLLVDTRYENLKPSAKVNALENLAGFLGLHTSSLSIQPEAAKDSSSTTATPNAGSSIVLSGPGNVARRREKHSTLVQWQVGCDGHFWQQYVDTIKQIPEQARDGTLSEVLQLPVYKWLVLSDSTDYTRNRRDTAPGSGDGYLRPDGDDDDDQEYDEEDDDYDENYDDNNEGITDSPQEPKPQKPIIRPVGGASSGGLDEHPHRHHHGEESIAGIHNLDNEEDSFWRNAEINNSIFNKTTTITPSTYPEPPSEPKEVSTSSSIPSSSDRATEEVEEEIIDAYDPYDTKSFFSSSSSTIPTTTTATATTPTPTTQSTSTATEPLTTPSTTPSTTSTTTTTTTEPPPPPSTASSTTTTTTTTEPSMTSTITTERIDFGIRNHAPRIERRLKKIPVTQGKVLSFEIPEDMFSDFEDGNTRNLRLQVYEKDTIPLKPSYWLQFNENTQEVYGLPRPDEEVYGNYYFEVVATDRGGLSVSDRLEIVVQQHKQERAFNHDFHLYLKIEKRNNFRTNVDWQLKVMRSLAELFGDNDLSYITVRSIDIEDDQAIYTWTNDSLARTDSCPQEEIDRLYSRLVSNKKTEHPSEALIRVLGPEIKVTRVVYQGLEQCQQSKETNHRWPIVRNQIDRLEALVGSLLVYKVRKDVFYDEDDGDTSKLKLSLYTKSRSDIPSYDWLQFDSKNQEFYGVPLKEDIGEKHYQLIARDKEGLEAPDSLVANVKPLEVEFKHTVEIKMKINMPYETFVHSAQHKREFIQKLANVYGEKNTSVINILSVSGNRETTDIVWRNFTLPEHTCPNDEITRMRKVLVKDDKSYSDELSREFNTLEFSIIQISFMLTGACHDVVVAGADIPSKDDTKAKGARQEEYLITFVLPAVIIAAMLILAGIIACILYKRRRSGKMSVSEKDDERQSFRSKGIPVIFQDELDEKPDPGNKSPIILKEEKPPLPPPEYQRAEDGADIPMLSKENSEEPYQPPPPFATNRDNNRQNRPKPTPTYRKPPPYVPP